MAYFYGMLAVTGWIALAAVMILLALVPETKIPAPKAHPAQRPSETDPDRHRP
jgi:hypothetical protein